MKLSLQATLLCWSTYMVVGSKSDHLRTDVFQYFDVLLQINIAECAQVQLNFMRKI